ncbi:MAG: L-threonylcarbamoyladenylate synthase [Candidatus Aenigmarchaeota archaeon]|nr:L-threonylcarbamoyladenylate synthase [Candidatus Aenigmarchaeota archaeon]
MAEVIKISNKDALSKAVTLLAKGGVIVYPTETSYGLGVDAENDRAVKKIITIKKRNKNKKISVAFSDLKMAKKYLVVTKDAEKLCKAFLPGPLTLLVESKNHKIVGFRIPDHKFVLSLIRKLGKPITATSANISGEGDLYKIKDVIKIFDKKSDLIIDGGNLMKRKPSTVYDVTERKVIRKGPIPEKRINAVLA